MYNGQYAIVEKVEKWRYCIKYNYLRRQSTPVHLRIQCSSIIIETGKQPLRSRCRKKYMLREAVRVKTLRTECSQ